MTVLWDEGLGLVNSTDSIPTSRHYFSGSKVSAALVDKGVPTDTEARGQWAKVRQIPILDSFLGWTEMSSSRK